MAGSGPLVCVARLGGVVELAGYGEHTKERLMMKRGTSLVHPDDAKVKPEPGPAGYVTAKVSKLKALGLPSKCKDGEIVENTQLEAGTWWCVYQSGGTLYGFAYEPGPAPFGNAETIELTILQAYDDETMQQIAA